MTTQQTCTVARRQPFISCCNDDTGVYMQGVPDIYDRRIWAIFSDNFKGLYRDYGILPSVYLDDGTGKAGSEPLHDAGDMEAFMARLAGKYPDSGPCIIVDNIDHKLYAWWKARPEHIRRAFSVYPSYEESWRKYDCGLREDIYNYCLIRENGLPLIPGIERMIVMLIARDLALLALEMLNNMPAWEMHDYRDEIYDEYSGQYDRLYGEIKAVITSITF